MITGDGFNNELDGGRSGDQIRGQGGNDLIDGGTGPNADILDGGAGTNDRVSYASSNSRAFVDLVTGEGFSDDGIDALTGFEGAIGTRFDDELIGTPSANTFDGNLGNDLIDGAGGSDWVEHFSHVSTLRGVTVDLAVDPATGQGTDTLTSIENARGSFFNDDYLRGGLGDDQVNGNGGRDVALFDLSVPVTVDLRAGTATGQGADSLTSIEGAVGSTARRPAGAR